MGGKIRWDRRTAGQKSREVYAHEEHESASSFAAHGRLLNQQHLHIVMECLASPHLWESLRPGLEKAAAYLRAHPHSGLRRAAAERYQKIAAILLAIEKGRIAPTSPKGLKVRQLGVKSKQPRPPWMDDPSLLPKKPPGRSP